MKVYTKGGDTGTTSLVGGARIKKYGVRIEAYGTVDELNSVVGMLSAAVKERYEDWYKLLTVVQNKLFNMGCYLATDNPNNDETEPYGLCEADVEKLEQAIDAIQEKLPQVNNFVLPGGSMEASIADLCRTTTRRAERRVVELADESYVNPIVVRYLNRLSDFFFVFARFNNIERKIGENLWNKEC
ncbi:MAG: cob(I)yrinic acid a,c-diamide adenosyltransferase [Muribaculaceae bacterium]|jgi:cob(I)alamin adenosyltransferase|nr:cob(I)yrinic acid a,c-diamide adenosyltransferase [Muribaculaceae bacterium]MEE1339008.1 cob(I)yrinic acid a,c-diamide adenosyltransferase [Muribaculaceae bacterium]